MPGNLTVPGTTMRHLTSRVVGTGHKLLKATSLLLLFYLANR